MKACRSENFARLVNWAKKRGALGWTTWSRIQEKVIWTKVASMNNVDWVGFRNEPVSWLSHITSLLCGTLRCSRTAPRHDRGALSHRTWACRPALTTTIDVGRVGEGFGRYQQYSLFLHCRIEFFRKARASAFHPWPEIPFPVISPWLSGGRGTP